MAVSVLRSSIQGLKGGLNPTCAEDFMFQGPKWRTEPSDLILPYNSPDQQAVIKCEAEGAPSPQYR
ncbi:Contactin-3 [Merluccius polli]|uniref:Contactin-3 n=1 Tax=Merluccius polli TaxID=89951 RepID=A0AA47MBE1_MERPO|nr:Contactin-3 [Merluccius polli]